MERAAAGDAELGVLGTGVGATTALGYALQADLVTDSSSTTPIGPRAPWLRSAR